MKLENGGARSISGNRTGSCTGSSFGIAVSVDNVVPRSSVSVRFQCSNPLVGISLIDTINVPLEREGSNVFRLGVTISIRVSKGIFFPNTLTSSSS